MYWSKDIVLYSTWKTDIQEAAIQPDIFNTKILLKCLIFIICYGKGPLESYDILRLLWI